MQREECNNEKDGTPQIFKAGRQREDHDLTQRQLAAILHMPQPQYNRYEQGLRDIPTVTLVQLADLYKTSTDYLLNRTDDPAPPKSL